MTTKQNTREYRLERLSTGESFVVYANSRKDAHDLGQLSWPGELIEVKSSSEHTDLQLWYEDSYQILKVLELAKREIPDQNYPEIVKHLQQARNHIDSLLIHFMESPTAGGK